MNAFNLKKDRNNPQIAPEVVKKKLQYPKHFFE